MNANRQFTRIVSLVAELTRADQEGEDATIGELAARHGVSETDIAADLRALTELGDRGNVADWLLSIGVTQQGDRVSIRSKGPFRRPVRLTPEEQLAVQVALLLDPVGAPLAKRFAASWAGETMTSPAPSSPQAAVDLIRAAVRDHLVVEVDYAGESDEDVRTRVIQPHQLAELGVRRYVVAWDEEVGAWRHFRLDRMVDVRPTTRPFEPRADFEPVREPRDTFRPDGTTERVTVRFRPEAAAWAAESFPDHRVAGDGSVLVEFEAADPRWLVRRVLEFGPDAEVLAPAHYRDAVRRAVA